MWDLTGFMTLFCPHGKVSRAPGGAGEVNPCAGDFTCVSGTMFPLDPRVVCASTSVFFTAGAQLKQ